MAARTRWWQGLHSTLVLMLASACLYAQTPPPLGMPQVPAGNTPTAARVALGKALFWDEQLSLTGTVACGTCHRPQAAGSDPRSAFPGVAVTHPGPDQTPGTADDIIGSPGVPLHDANGDYQIHPLFGLRPQVGARKANSTLNAAFLPRLFWDGRAISLFLDPVSQAVIFGNFAALESQALAPLLSTAEMGYPGLDLNTLIARIGGLRPLALAADVPPELARWLGQRSYPELFAEAYGSSTITPARLAMAIASYQRVLIANQAPIDIERGGTPTLTAQELAGEQVFNDADCDFCHSGPLFTDGDFHYIGVRPAAEDPGHNTVSGESNDLGRMRTPGLRNVAERAPYMHNGRLASLQDVIEFYNRGGDFSAPNKDPRVRPRNWSASQKAALLAFLSRPLSDPRVLAETPPFDRPTLYSESTRVPQILGTGRAGSGGRIPQLTALEPPLRGSNHFTLVLSEALAAAPAVLVVSSSDPGLGSGIPSGSFEYRSFDVDSQGLRSLHLDLSAQRTQAGDILWARVYVQDPIAAGGIAITPAARFTVFEPAVDVLFVSSFE